MGGPKVPGGQRCTPLLVHGIGPGRPWEAVGHGQGWGVMMVFMMGLMGTQCGTGRTRVDTGLLMDSVGVCGVSVPFSLRSCSHLPCVTLCNLDVSPR